ncbi:hypothetical protein BC938DRAFT_481849, partial [Jimgerdemannia flammicorona]
MPFLPQSWERRMVSQEMQIKALWRWIHVMKHYYKLHTVGNHKFAVAHVHLILFTRIQRCNYVTVPRRATLVFSFPFFSLSCFHSLAFTLWFEGGGLFIDITTAKTSIYEYIILRSEQSNGIHLHRPTCPGVEVPIAVQNR